MTSLAIGPSQIVTLFAIVFFFVSQAHVKTTIHILSDGEQIASETKRPKLNIKNNSKI